MTHDKPKDHHASSTLRSTVSAWASPLIALLALGASIVALIVSTQQGSKISGTSTCLGYITLVRQLSTTKPPHNVSTIRRILRKTGSTTDDPNMLVIERECGTIPEITK